MQKWLAEEVDILLIVPEGIEIVKTFGMDVAYQFF